MPLVQQERPWDASEEKKRQDVYDYQYEWEEVPLTQKKKNNFNLRAVSFALTAIGAGMGAFSLLRQGKEEGQLFDYSAAIDEFNAREARRRAEKNAKRFSRQGQRELSTQRAAIGASGVAFSGSVADIILEDSERIAMDAAAIRYAGELEALNFEEQAAMKRIRGRQARRAGKEGFYTSLLRGGAKAAALL